MAKRAVRVKGLAVVTDYAGGFLSAVLKGMQAKRSENAGLVASKDAEDATFLVKAVKGIESCKRLVFTPCHSWKPALCCPLEHVQQRDGAPSLVSGKSPAKSSAG